MSTYRHDPKITSIYRLRLILTSNMVLNTITNNMENTMKRKPIFHNDTAIKNALLLFGQGWKTGRIAKKMKVSEATVYNWKNKFPKYAVRKVTGTNLTKNGKLTTTNIKPVVTKSTVKSTVLHEITITLDGKMHKHLMDLATYEVRTVSDQVKYLVHRELERVERNSKNIPF